MNEPTKTADDAGQTLAPGASGPQGQRRAAALFSGFVVVFMVAIVVVPLFFTSFSDEVGRWRLAAAWEHRLNGDLESAINSLTLALEDDPNHVEICLQRAAWYEQVGDLEAALQDFNKVYELAANDRRMLRGRAVTYHRMGKSAESIADSEQLLKGVRGDDRSDALNFLAYMRALNNTDLDQALTDINESIDLDSVVRRKLGIAATSAALLDTRGLIRYQQGEFDAALDDLEPAVSGYSMAVRRSQFRLNSGMGIVDLRRERLDMQLRKKALAVVVYHRGLTYEKLGKTDLAEVDFDRVRLLGFDPNEELY